MKTVHDRITKVGREFRVSLTDLQDSPLGKMLHKLYYSGNGDLCDLAPNSTGTPHSGGQHTFTMRGPKEDLVTYMDLLEDSCKGYWWANDTLVELSAIKRALVEA